MKKTVWVDLDDTLSDYSKGWQGVDTIGDPLPGSQVFLRDLSEFARVGIYTTRCKVDVKSRNGESLDYLCDKVREWLDRHGFYYDEIYVGQGKPLGAAYVDDRGVECRPNEPESLLSAGGWYRRALERCKILCEVGK